MTPSRAECHARSLFEPQRWAVVDEALRTAPTTGDLVVCGVADGGLVGYLAEARHSQGVRGYCRFDAGLAAPSVHDGGDLREGLCSASFEATSAWLAAWPTVQLVKGDVEQTLHDLPPVALAVIDLNLYGPTKHALEQIWPALVPGGIVLIDDWGWTGVNAAIGHVVDAALWQPKGYLLWLQKP